MAMTANRQDTLKWKMTNAALAITKASVTPIMRSKIGQIGQEGTGTFFELGKHKLMVTAGHVLQIIFDGDWMPFVLDGFDENEQIKPVPLLGRSEWCGEPYDIGITLLDSGTTNLLSDRSYLPLTAVDLGPVLPGAFCVGGFPAALGLGVPDSKAVSGCMICTKLYTGSAATFKGVDQNWHILVDRMESAGSTDGEGRPSGLPDSLGGASGSPVFQTYQDGTPFWEWNPGHIRMVGVATGEWREAILATRWAAVLACAYNFFPELREELDAMGMIPNRIPVPAAIYR
jgi:hypothetical protein